MVHFIGAEDRNRTPVTAVKGRCLDRLTNGPQRGYVLLSQAVAHQVPLPLKSLTSVFGMGTGVSSLL